MKVINRDTFKSLLETARIKKRLQRDLRFVPEEISDWEQRDFLAVTTKSGNEGVLLYKNSVLPFVLTPRPAKQNGRTEAIICDICASWRRGTESAMMTFDKRKSTLTYLVCADLDCSLHVRTMTKAAALSRTQLREHMTNELRIERLISRLEAIIDNIHE